MFGLTETPIIWVQVKLALFDYNEAPQLGEVYKGKVHKKVVNGASELRPEGDMLANVQIAGGCLRLNIRPILGPLDCSRLPASLNLLG
ncbi:hypothetical protein CEQ36_11150 [Yersinia intermedia]|uniref:hypothetical protein n=1 Tax=Yersinia intermedia TaxID=631 RepID=UPI0005DD540E|nr:hypothetical protein [Yersinia intermedia]ARB86267.1 hypothetical protein A6J67_21450 [Yersinia sp. FDAARGOS_228]AVL36122.1 hypothetical protein CEQ36_11150 [Yersinia intermedia]CND52169.1 Uncharacterised protein [Yersinia intermedia]CNI36296.1 Uncharacterised protein [Yersinia intermedia]